ncbi:hypothetical protein AXF42_Ash016324 [Apostasia shenzhenica]|uniref:Filament-like plant protein 3 n=1 Tax=Apostasia shenzhenica TaxID=1088818 RepID=A0A2H9ZXH1_9ASPA|nr:hypothetical protein AXF42_Ash016324 [Apostasia shenzhenica]
MDRRSWLWRRKSSEKSPGETESSGSASSHSERFSEDQEALRGSPVTISPNHAQSPEISSKLTGYDANETMKSLNEKLSAALLSINAKEELVKQHARVAEEAVSGWEKAEADVAGFKKKFEAALQKNSALEDRANHLDEALKECVRQLRQSREVQEQKVHEALTKKTKEWENEKFELETQIVELQAKLEVKIETTSSLDLQLQLKLDTLEKENSSLKIELLARMEELRLRTLERDLTTQSAETASKQHLESTKKLAKLEAECRRLRALNRKSSPVNNHKSVLVDQKSLYNSICVESLTESVSDSGDLLNGVDNEQSCSDSWASQLIAELDQFKNEKATARNVSSSSMEIDLMDDFLEMERLAALPEASHPSSTGDGETDFSITRDSPSRSEVQVLCKQRAELEQKVAEYETEKAQMVLGLSEARGQLKISCDKLITADSKLIELQQKLDTANELKHIFESQVEAANSKRKELESQLEIAELELGKLHEKIILLEGKLNTEKALSEKLELKLKDLYPLEVRRNELEFQLEKALLESTNLHEKVQMLEKEVEEERKLSSDYLARWQSLEVINEKWKEADSHLLSATKEVDEFHNKLRTLEGKLKQEEEISVDLTADIEGTEAKRKLLSTQLESAIAESMKLNESLKSLQKEIEDEKALSAELASKCQHLEYQLTSAHFEIGKLHEKVTSLERIADEERKSAESATMAEAAAVANRKVMESQVSLAHMEVEELSKKVNFLECKVEEEKTISAALRANLVGMSDEINEELATKLESANLAVQELQKKLSSLEKELDEERLTSTELAARLQNLDDELSRMKQNVDLQGSISSDVHKPKQERDLALAAEKFAACRKTIDSLTQQLKSLSNFENLMLGPELPE